MLTMFQIWQYVETAQILQTVNAPGPKPTSEGVLFHYFLIHLGGIKFELEEVESRNEEYPYAIAFMSLIEQVELTILH